MLLMAFVEMKMQGVCVCVCVCVCVYSGAHKSSYICLENIIK